MDNGCQFSGLNWSIWTQQNYTDAIEKIECSNYDEACYVYETLKKENPDAFRISMMANDKYELFTNRNREYFTGHNLEN